MIESKSSDSNKHMAELVQVMNARFDVADSSVLEIANQHDDIGHRLTTLASMIESMASTTKTHNIATPPIQPPPLLGSSGHL